MPKILIQTIFHNPSLILVNRLNIFHVKVIRLSVTLEIRHFLPATEERANIVCTVILPNLERLRQGTIIISISKR